MRIAVLIISLCLTMIVGLQSCAVMVGGGMTNDQETSGSGAIGLLIAFLFVLGAGLCAVACPSINGVLRDRSVPRVHRGRFIDLSGHVRLGDRVGWTGDDVVFRRAGAEA